MEIETKNPKETKELAKEFMKNLLEKAKKGPVVVELSGDLGSGKTTFMQGVGEFFGILNPMVSPTFVIQKNYKTAHGIFKKLVHIDAYRIEESKDLSALKWAEYSTDPESIIFIEWSANMKINLENVFANISFEHVDENTRKIKITYA